MQYIGAAGRPLSEAEQTAEQTRSQIGKPVNLRLRFTPFGPEGAREDRSFNARARIDAFAGRLVVRDAAECDTAASQDILAGKPVACTFVEFRGPINQKLLVNNMRVEQQDDRVVFSEMSRSIFARRMVAGDTRSFPPITTDQETIVELTKLSDGRVSGRLRLVSYLQPLDALYFAANKASVSISDYSLSLVPVTEDVKT